MGRLRIGRNPCLFDNGLGSRFLTGGPSMSSFRPIMAVVLILASPIVLGGCPAAIVAGLGAAGGTGYAANQERGTGGTVDDLKIKTNIQSAWLQTNPLMQRDLNVTVYEGRTLLTGTAADQQFKAQAT